MMFREGLDLVEDLWLALKPALESMVVSRVEKKSVDEIKKSYRMRGETNLDFSTCMDLLF